MVMVGTQYFDFIQALSAQKIFSYAGDDIIVGSGSDDTVYAGSGNDILLGNNGVDRLYGGNGSDSLYGDYGDVGFSFGNHNDYLFGGSGSDTLYGGYGDDTLNGGTSGSEADFYVFDAVSVMEGNLGDFISRFDFGFDKIVFMNTDQLFESSNPINQLSFTGTTDVLYFHTSEDEKIPVARNLRSFPDGNWQDAIIFA